VETAKDIGFDNRGAVVEQRASGDRRHWRRGTTTSPAPVGDKGGFEGILSVSSPTGHLGMSRRVLMLDPGFVEYWRA
jgi:hypothetical protein